MRLSFTFFQASRPDFKAWRVVIGCNLNRYYKEPALRAIKKLDAGTGAAPS